MRNQNMEGKKKFGGGGGWGVANYRGPGRYKQSILLGGGGGSEGKVTSLGGGENPAGSSAGFGKKERPVRTLLKGHRTLPGCPKSVILLKRAEKKNRS